MDIYRYANGKKSITEKKYNCSSVNIWVACSESDAEVNPGYLTKLHTFRFYVFTS